MKTLSLKERMLIESGFTPPLKKSDDKDEKENINFSGVGVLVIRDGKILTGLRRAEGTFCGPGGHIEDGESPEQAAIRETQEEFGITPKELIPLGELEGVEGLYCPSTVFLCTDYEGRAQADGEEMQTARFMEPEQVFSLIKAGVAFQPFAESIQLLLSQCLTSEIPLDTIKVGTFSSDGGPGSGNFGHKRKPGEVGGSGGGSSGSSQQSEESSKPDKTHELKIAKSQKGEKPSDAFKSKCLATFKGAKTSDGKTVKSIHEHAIYRMESKGIYPESALKALSKGRAGPGNKADRTVYSLNGTNVVFDNKAKMITTCIYKGKKGKK